MDFLKVTKNHLEYREPNFEEEEKNPNVSGRKEIIKIRSEKMKKK